VGSIADPIDGRYDLLTCIEVLGYLPETEAIRAIASMTNATDRIVFSSSPPDFSESLQINARPTIYWLRLFAARGFAPDIAYDATFILPHSVVLERVKAEWTERDLVACAELTRARLLVADHERTSRNLEAERARAVSNLEAEQARAASNLEAERARAKDEQATLMQAISKLQAEKARIISDLKTERVRALSMEAEYDSIIRSASWIGTAPLRFISSWIRNVTIPLRRALRRK
jgi:hypothetical protein